MVISLSALGFSAALSGWLLSRDAAPHNLFYGLLAFDRFSNLFRILFAFVTATILVFSVPETTKSRREGEQRHPRPGRVLHLAPRPHARR